MFESCKHGHPCVWASNTGTSIKCALPVCRSNVMQSCSEDTMTGELFQWLEQDTPKWIRELGSDDRGGHEPR